MAALSWRSCLEAEAFTMVEDTSQMRLRDAAEADIMNYVNGTRMVTCGQEHLTDY
jgi:hypothetical protein